MVTVYTVKTKDTFGKDQHGICLITSLKEEAEDMVSHINNYSQDKGFITTEVEDIYKYSMYNAINISSHEQDYLLSLVETAEQKKQIRKNIEENKY